MKEHLKLIEPACQSQFNFIGWLAFLGGLFFFSGVVWFSIDIYLTASGKSAVESYVLFFIVFIAGGTSYYLSYMEMDTGNAIVATQNKVSMMSTILAFIISAMILFFGIHMFASKVGEKLIFSIDRDKTVTEINKQLKTEIDTKRIKYLKSMKLQRVAELQEEIENKTFFYATLFALFGIIIRFTYAFGFMSKDGVKIPFLKRDIVEAKEESYITPFPKIEPQNKPIQNSDIKDDVFEVLKDISQNGQVPSRNVVLEELKRKGIKANTTSLSSAYSHLVNEGLLERREDRGYKIA